MPPRNFKGQFSDWPTTVVILAVLFLLINALEKL